MDAEETKRWKARNLRYKKPIVRNLNIAQIQEDLWENSRSLRRCTLVYGFRGWY